MTDLRAGAARVSQSAAVPNPKPGIRLCLDGSQASARAPGRRGGASVWRPVSGISYLYASRLPSGAPIPCPAAPVHHTKREHNCVA